MQIRQVDCVALLSPKGAVDQSWVFYSKTWRRDNPDSMDQWSTISQPSALCLTLVPGVLILQNQQLTWDPGEKILDSVQLAVQVPWDPGGSTGVTSQIFNLECYTLDHHCISYLLHFG